jgi:hypothetical protein
MVVFAFLTLWAFIVVLPTNIAGVRACLWLSCTLSTHQCPEGNFVQC